MGQAPIAETLIETSCASLDAAAAKIDLGTPLHPSREGEETASAIAHRLLEQLPGGPRVV